MNKLKITKLIIIKLTKYLLVLRNVLLSALLALIAACGDDINTATDDVVVIALVRQISAGDYFEQYQRGAIEEAKRLNIELMVYNADGDDEKQAMSMHKALNAGVDAIAVEHGSPEIMQPAIAAAIAAGTPVVTFDTDPGNTEVPMIYQSDALLARLALNQMLADIGGVGKVIYIYVPGYPPLERRDAVWQEIKAANPQLEEVAVIGTVNESIKTTVADEAKIALKVNPNTVAIFAPFDEFAKGAVLAIQELGMQDQVKVYGADISTEDIAIMTAANSPWVVTSATDPSNVGRVTIRAAYLVAKGEKLPNPIIVPPTLITRDHLLENNVVNMTDLIAKMPELTTVELIPVE